MSVRVKLIIWSPEAQAGGEFQFLRKWTQGLWGGGAVVVSGSIYFFPKSLEPREELKEIPAPLGTLQPPEKTWGAGCTHNGQKNRGYWGLGHFGAIWGLVKKVIFFPKHLKKRWAILNETMSIGPHDPAHVIMSFYLSWIKTTHVSKLWLSKNTVWYTCNYYNFGHLL